MDDNTRPWYTIDELNAWADKYQNEQWHKAAIRLGEELASVGPVGYYEMDANEWLDWALLNVQQRTWVDLTEEEKIKLWDRAEKRQAYQSVPAFIALIQEVESKLKEKNL